jgi:uncharacterized protein (TIGR02145 family)
MFKINLHSISMPMKTPVDASPYLRSFRGLLPLLALMILIWFVSLQGCRKDDPDKVPVIVTLAVHGVCIEMAWSGGESLSDAGDLIIEKGVCWSTNSNPTIADERTKEGMGANSFKSHMTGLKPSTRYYARAYAVNSHGTGYGQVFSFVTKSNLMTDIDNNTYRLKNIGGLIWMVENLMVTRFNDGTPIPVVTPGNEWHDQTGPARCWYQNSETNYHDLYGVLYNWYAAGTGKLCPEGWRVPTEDDFMVMEEYLGMDTAEMKNPGYRGGALNIGGMMKKTGVTVWNPPNLGATNESGFGGLPGGARNQNGVFGFHKDYGFWWTGTDTYTGFAFMRALSADLNSVFKNHYDMRNGFSVRCVREEGQ